MNEYKVTILGAGLAGCEAALWLAGKGVQVELYEQKPVHFSPAHKSEGFAELICSNSLKAERLDSASGLLKEEMRRMGAKARVNCFFCQQHSAIFDVFLRSFKMRTDGFSFFLKSDYLEQSIFDIFKNAHF